MIKMVWTRMSSVNLETDIVDRLNTILDNARGHMKKGEFKKAVELAMQSIQIIQEKS